MYARTAKIKIKYVNKILIIKYVAMNVDTERVIYEVRERPRGLLSANKNPSLSSAVQKQALNRPACSLSRSIRLVKLNSDLPCKEFVIFIEAAKAPKVTQQALQNYLSIQLLNLFVTFNVSIYS
ncbi:hypothetical protein ACJJTC_013385 [Scirpophaga incertulas]